MPPLQLSADVHRAGSKVNKEVRSAFRQEEIMSEWAFNRRLSRMEQDIQKLTGCMLRVGQAAGKPGVTGYKGSLYRCL
jgi:hypothetical protein